MNLRSGRGPVARESASGDAAGLNGWSQRGGPDPVVVDESFMACCNLAFEAAQVHGAAEVRVEHLLHAMTRVRAASELLEHLGIGTAALRQETAVAIASEEPAASDGQRKPRTSGEVGDIVRQAASLATGRRTQAGVADLLYALLDPTRMDATGFLSRAATDAHALERWRGERRAASGSGTDPQLRARADAADGILKRLDGVEAMLRTLQAEVAAGRAAITEALSRRAEPALDAGELRLATSSLQDSVTSALASLEPRLSGLERLAGADSVAYLGARMEVIEKQLERQPGVIAEAVSSMTAARTEDPEAEERLGLLAGTVQTHLQRADEAASTHEHALTEIYEALVKLGANQQTLAGNLNTWRIESSGDVAIISNRLREMEHRSVDAFSSLASDVQSLRLESGAASPWNAFKRWLYGTTSVLSGAWRNDPDSVRARMQPGQPEPEPEPARLQEPAVVEGRPSAEPSIRSEAASEAAAPEAPAVSEAALPQPTSGDAGPELPDADRQPPDKPA